MKIKAERNDLFSLLNRCQSIVEKKTTMPALINILLKSKRNTLKLFATNLEVSFVDEIIAEIDEPGDVAVNSKSLFNIIKELPEGPVQLIKQENNWLKVSQSKSNFKISGIHPSEYPDFPEIKAKHFSSIKASALSEMIDKTIFSVSNDETRYHLNGVYFERVSSDEFKMVSTDGHRLSLINKSLGLVSNGLSWLSVKEGVIIPRKGLNEIKKLSESNDDESIFHVTIDGSQLVLCHEKVVLMIRLIEGRFPNYEQLIPQSLKERILFNREELLAALRRVFILCDQKSKNVIFDLSEGCIKISSRDTTLGSAKEEIEIDYQGEDFKVGFNIKYFLDVLTTMNVDEVDIELQDNSSPGLLRPHGDKSYTCVIMPMRV